MIAKLASFVRTRKPWSVPDYSPDYSPMKVSFPTLVILLVAALSSAGCDKEVSIVLPKIKVVDATPTPPTRQSFEPEMVAIPNQNYEMGKYEVTQAQWQAVMGNNPSEFKNCGDNCPVESVSWNDTQEYIQKINAKTGKNYRLPTNNEWQTACLAGSQSEYCGGNDSNAVAWYSDSKTHPVGQKSPNAFGLYDMSGNVFEWMQDKYDNDDLPVLRGGSWSHSPQYSRAAKRSNGDPAGRVANSGFRLARTLP